MYRQYIWWILLFSTTSCKSDDRFVSRKCCKSGQALDWKNKYCIQDSRGGGNGSAFFQTITISKDKQTIREDRVVKLYESEGELAWDCTSDQRLVYSKSVSGLFFNESMESIGFLEFGIGRMYGYKDFCMDSADIKGKQRFLVMVCPKCKENCVSLCDHNHDITKESKKQPFTLQGKNYTKVMSELHCDKTKLDEERFEEDYYASLPLSDYCFKQEKNETKTYLVCIHRVVSTTNRYMELVLCALSFLSLSIIIIIHIIIREFRKQPGTKIKVGIFWNLMVLFLVLFITKLKDFRYINYSLCVGGGIAIQFFGLSAFFWMTTLGYDVWQRLRAMRMPEESNLHSVRKYILFSVGGPVVISSITLILQLYTEKTSEQTQTTRSLGGGVFDEAKPYIYNTHPGIGVQSCFLNSHLPKIIYFHSEMLLLLVANMFFFLAICYNFFLGTWRSRSQAFRRNYRQKVGVLVQIFTFMGIFWLTENVQAFLHWNGIYSRWFFILDALNLLTGFFLLLLFLSLKTNRQTVAAAIRELKTERVRQLFDSQKSQRTNRSRLSVSTPDTILRSRNASGITVLGGSSAAQETPSPQPDFNQPTYLKPDPPKPNQPDLTQAYHTNRNFQVDQVEMLQTTTEPVDL